MQLPRRQWCQGWAVRCWSPNALRNRSVELDCRRQKRCGQASLGSRFRVVFRPGAEYADTVEPCACLVAKMADDDNDDDVERLIMYIFAIYVLWRALLDEFALLDESALQSKRKRVQIRTKHKRMRNYSGPQLLMSPPDNANEMMTSANHKAHPPSFEQRRPRHLHGSLERLNGRLGVCIVRPENGRYCGKYENPLHAAPGTPHVVQTGGPAFRTTKVTDMWT
jgi:hypothetical protein